MGLEDTWGSGVASGVGYDLQGLSESDLWPV